MKRCDVCGSAWFRDDDEVEQTAGEMHITSIRALGFDTEYFIDYPSKNLRGGTSLKRVKIGSALAKYILKIRGENAELKDALVAVKKALSKI